MKNWLLLLLVGIVSIVLGGIAIVNPQIMSLSLNVLVSWGMIFVGIATILVGIMRRLGGLAIWTVLLGIFMTAIGVAIFNNPLAGIATLSFIIGILMIISGLVTLFSAFSEGMEGYRFLSIISSLASFVIAYYVISESAIALGVLVGIQLVINGFGIVAIAMGLRELTSFYR